MINLPTFVPFFGVVENIDDPKDSGRVQVRCFGYHTSNKGMIPTDYLQWFMCVTSNSAGVSGIGDTPNGYVNGSMVFGYFLDRTMQAGIVVGSISGAPEHFAYTNQGFNDPDGVYPTYIDEPDFNRLGRESGDKHWMHNIKEQNRIKRIQLPLGKGEWAEPPYAHGAKYPHNRVFESRSGHVKEYDDTPGKERIHEYHRAGTYTEIDEKGNRVLKIVGDGYEITAGDKNVNIRGTCNVTVEGDINWYVKGDWITQIDGDKREVVQGSVFEQYDEQRTEVKGSHNVQASESSVDADDYTVNSCKINLNEG